MVWEGAGLSPEEEEVGLVATVYFLAFWLGYQPTTHPLICFQKILELLLENVTRLCNQSECASVYLHGSTGHAKHKTCTPRSSQRMPSSQTCLPRTFTEEVSHLSGKGHGLPACISFLLCHLEYGCALEAGIKSRACFFWHCFSSSLNVHFCSPNRCWAAN